MDTETKKYYWIKLKTDFFAKDEIDYLLSQKNGCEYIVLYQMLCLITANNDGQLASKVGEMMIRFDPEKIVRETKYFKIDTVVVALELYKTLGLIYEGDNNILKISYHNDMVGGESKWAEKKRIQRQQKNQKQIGHEEDNVRQEIEIEYRDKILYISDKNDKNDKYSMHEFLDELKEDHKIRFINTILQYVIKRFNQKPAEEKAQINNIPNYIKSAVLQNIQILQSRSELSDDLYSEEYLEELLNKKD